MPKGNKRTAILVKASQSRSRKAPTTVELRGTSARAERRREKKTERPRPARPAQRSTGSSSVLLASAPAGRAMTMRLEKRGSHNAVRLSGTEYLGAIVLGETGSATAGTILFNAQNTPNIPGSRITHFASLYQRWHAIKYTYRFIPAVSTTTAGTLVHAQDPDPTTNWQSGPGAVARLLSSSGARLRQVHEPANTPLPSSSDYTSLWTRDVSATVDASDRLSSAGQYIVAVAAPFSLPASTAVGTLELDYDIVFYVDKLDTLQAQRESVIRMPLTPSFAAAAGVTGVVGEFVKEFKSSFSDTTKFGQGLDTFAQFARVFTGPGGGPMLAPNLKTTFFEGGTTSGGWAVNIDVFNADRTASGTPTDYLSFAGESATPVGAIVYGDDSSYQWNVYQHNPVGCDWRPYTANVRLTWCSRSGFAQAPGYMDILFPVAGTIPATVVIQLTVRAVNMDTYSSYNPVTGSLVTMPRAMVESKKSAASSERKTALTSSEPPPMAARAPPTGAERKGPGQPLALWAAATQELPHGDRPCPRCRKVQLVDHCADCREGMEHHRDEAGREEHTCDGGLPNRPPTPPARASALKSPRPDDVAPPTPSATRVSSRK